MGIVKVKNIIQLSKEIGIDYIVFQNNRSFFVEDELKKPISKEESYDIKEFGKMTFQKEEEC